jgi:hypothetical protein
MANRFLRFLEVWNASAILCMVDYFLWEKMGNKIFAPEMRAPELLAALYSPAGKRGFSALLGSDKTSVQGTLQSRQTVVVSGAVQDRGFLAAVADMRRS